MMMIFYFIAKFFFLTLFKLIFYVFKKLGDNSNL